MDFDDEFFHLSFTNQLAVAMNPSLGCPLDDGRINAVLPKGFFWMEVGVTDDVVLIRLMKMLFQRQNTIAELKKVEDSDPKSWPPSNEAGVIAFIAGTRVVEIFPREANTGSTYHFVSATREYPAEEALAIYKSIQPVSSISVNSTSLQKPPP